MVETITITKRGNIRVAQKSKRSYFMVNDDKGREFVCFNQGAFNEMPVGTGVVVEITERDGQTSTIDLIKEAEKPEAPTSTQVEKPKTDKFGEGQREGMWWKELGEIIRADQMVKMFGKENAIAIIKAYRAELLGATRIPFDGAKLPQWKKENIEGG